MHVPAPSAATEVAMHHAPPPKRPPPPSSDAGPAAVVSFSTAALKASAQSGDADHDGDSR
jgi:hypothetical protein